jgi:hypothetical protein
MARTFGEDAAEATRKEFERYENMAELVERIVYVAEFNSVRRGHPGP